MNGDVIANTIEVESLNVIPNLIDAAIGGVIGDRIVGGVVVPKPAAPPTVPQSVAMWQARAILIKEGLLTPINNYFASIADPVKREQAIAKFEYSSTVQRTDTLVTKLIPALGKSEAQIDQMFIDAAAL